MKPEELLCEYCGNELSTKWPFEIGTRYGSTYQFHTGCREAAEHFRSTKAMHELWCHKPECDGGPTNPFGEPSV